MLEAQAAAQHYQAPVRLLRLPALFDCETGRTQLLIRARDTHTEPAQARAVRAAARYC
jgi:hypothetical protein